MRKTKIVCTLGPATDNIDTLTNVIREGMDVARFNFSHGSHEEHGIRMNLLKQAREITGKHVPILLDTKGIKIRTGYVEGYGDANKSAIIELKKGETITYICDSTQTEMNGKLSTPSRMYIDYDNMPKVVKIGQRVMLDDGLIATEITSINGNEVSAKILNPGRIKSRRAVNLPGAKLDLEFLTPKDQADIVFGVSQDVDFIALSFVRRMEDVVKARKFMDAHGGKKIMIISKIENQEGVENLDEILAISDGVMVARGDMAVEIPFEQVPGVQKQMIAKGLIKGKIVITATQMLHSMINEPTPTRAEVSDIFNAVEDLSACVMLSGETANGSYPLEAVRTMATVAKTAEDNSDYELIVRSRPHGHVTSSICRAAVDLANQVNAKAIVAYSESGLTARRLSALRTSVPLIVISYNPQVMRQCHAMWGLRPVLQPPVKTSEELFTNALLSAENQVNLEDGDNIIVVAGTVVGISGSTNTVRVMTKGDVVLRGTAMNSYSAKGTIKICKDLEEAQQKLQKGDIAVLYRFFPEFEQFLDKVGGILLVSNEYDQHLLAKSQNKNIPIIVEVHAVENRVSDGMMVEVIGAKSAVLRR